MEKHEWIFLVNPMFHSITNLKKMVSENLIFDYILVLSYLFGINILATCWQ